MKELRCEKCNKLLGKADIGSDNVVEIRCNGRRCRYLNKFKREINTEEFIKSCEDFEKMIMDAHNLATRIEHTPLVSEKAVGNKEDYNEGWRALSKHFIPFSKQEDNGAHKREKSIFERIEDKILRLSPGNKVLYNNKAWIVVEFWMGWGEAQRLILRPYGRIALNKTVRGNIKINEVVNID